MNIAVFSDYSEITYSR